MSQVIENAIYAALADLGTRNKVSGFCANCRHTVDAYVPKPVVIRPTVGQAFKALVQAVRRLFR